jgi:hypothetical protein
MKAALALVLMVASAGCSLVATDGVPGARVDAATFAADKSPKGDLEDKIESLQEQIAKLKAQAEKIESVAAAIEALMPELTAAVGNDPGRPLGKLGESDWQRLLADSVQICQQANCSQDIQRQLAALCAGAKCAQVESPAPSR